MNKFWKFETQQDKDGKKKCQLIIYGPLSESSWWGDEITPKAFRSELDELSGDDIEVHLDSPGGDVFAGVAIYNSLRDYAGKVTVFVDGLAASAASLVAMAGDEVIMRPGAMIMIHEPWSVASGNAEALRKSATVLDEIKQAVVPIYTNKTGLSRTEIEEMMSDETWLSAKKAVAKNFADRIESEKDASVKNVVYTNFMFSMSADASAVADLMNKIGKVSEMSVEDEAIIEQNAEVEEPAVEEAGASAQEADEAEAPANGEEKTEADGEQVAEGEGEPEADEAENAEGEKALDALEEAVAKLKSENSALKEEISKYKQKMQDSVAAKNALAQRYANILGMAVSADEDENQEEKAAEDEGKTKVSRTEQAYADAFAELGE